MPEENDILEAKAERVCSLEINPDLILQQFMIEERIVGNRRTICVQDKIPKTAKVKRTGIGEGGNVIFIIEDESFQPVNPGCFIPKLTPTYRAETITGE